MFPPVCRLLIHSLLLLAWADCQQAEVGETEAGGKGSSSLAEFVDNLIDQMNAKVGMIVISILDTSTHLMST